MDLEKRRIDSAAASSHLSSRFEWFIIIFKSGSSSRSGSLVTGNFNFGEKKTIKINRIGGSMRSSPLMPVRALPF